MILFVSVIKHIIITLKDKSSCILLVVRSSRLVVYPVSSTHICLNVSHVEMCDYCDDQLNNNVELSGGTNYSTYH